MLDWLSKFLFAFSRRTLKLSVPLLTELVQCTELCTVAPAASDIILLFRKMRSSPQNVFPDPAPNVSLMARDSLESVTTGHPRTKKAKFRISRFIFENLPLEHETNRSAFSHLSPLGSRMDHKLYSCPLALLVLWRVRNGTYHVF